MTYKELVNAVLARLREDSVGSVTETDYSALVGAFVNDAKTIVEDAWSWRALLRSVNIPVTANVSASYDLEDYTTNEGSEQLNERCRLFLDPKTGKPLVRIITNDREREIEVVTQTYNFITRQAGDNDSTAGQIEKVYFGVNPTAASGKTNLRMFTYPSEPDTSETIQVFVINPQNDLSSNDTALLVPSEPVKQLAYLYCLYERGEELGEFLTLTSRKADQALADAISFDASQTSNPTFVFE